MAARAAHVSIGSEGHPHVACKCSFTSVILDYYLRSVGEGDVWHATQVVGLMRLPPADQDERLAKAALFSKFAELLPAALLLQLQTGEGGGHVLGGAGGHAAADARDLVADLLSAIQEVIAGDPTPYQNLFRHGLAFWLFLLLLKGCAKWVPAHLARTSPSADTASRSYVERCV